MKEISKQEWIERFEFKPGVEPDVDFDASTFYDNGAVKGRFKRRLRCKMRSSTSERPIVKTESEPETKRRTDYAVERLEDGQWRNVNCFEDLSKAIDCRDRLKARYGELRIVRMDCTVILTEIEQ